MLRSNNGIGDPQGQVVMGMHAALRIRPQNPVIRLEPVTIPIHVQRPAGIGHIDAMGAIRFHQPGLFGKGFRIAHVTHHQESGHVHPQLARETDMLLRNIGFGAMRGDSDRHHAQIESPVQVLHRPDSGQQQGRQAGLADRLACGGNPVPVRMGSETIIERRPAQAVAMRHLDGIHPGFVQGGRDLAHMVHRVSVADRMHAVAQRHILDIEPVMRGIEHHATRPMPCAAIFSAVASAADVMMSRLPA